MWTRLRYQADPPPLGELPMAAVLIALFEDDEGEVRVVLTKRPDTMPTHAGHIAFPGGRSHPEDDGPVSTALREAEEEVGIPPPSVEILGYLPAMDTVEFRPMVVPVVGRLPEAPLLMPDPREVAAVYSPRLSDLVMEKAWKEKPYRDFTIRYYDLDGETLWGATAFMLWQLLDMATPSGHQRPIPRSLK